MSGIADDAPTIGGMASGTLAALYYLLTTFVRWHKARAIAKEQAKVPPSPQLEPPPPDPAVLRRLDAIEHESALSVALVRERGVVDDLRRELVETRRERDQLLVELRAERALTARLRAEIRARRNRGAVEVSAAEHRDASQAGPLQDSLDTRRPPKR